MSVSHGTSKTRPRHVPVRNASHVYKSQNADGSWTFEVRYYDLDGKRKYMALPGASLTAAKAKAHELHGAAGPVVVDVKTTFSQVVEDWRENRTHRPSSASRYDGLLDRHILKLLGRTKVRDIDARAIQRVLDAGPQGAASRKLTYITIRNVLGHAVEMGALNTVPRLPRSKAPKAAQGGRRIISADETTRLLTYADAREDVLPQVVRVALGTAARIGELAGLRWEDIDFGAKTIRIERTMHDDGSCGPTKGGKARTIPMMPLAREALLELRLDGSGDGHVFLNRDGAPLTPERMRQAFNSARDDAALQTTEDGKVVFHSLRHTAISRLANSPGVVLVHVRDFAGHTDLTTTQTYIHKVEDASVVSAMEAALAA